MRGYTGECLLIPKRDFRPWWKRIIWPPVIFTVARAFVFSCRYGTVEIPAGMPTDGASVPRPMRWIFPPVGDYLRAAVVHDAALKQNPRQVADEIFLEAMLYDGVPEWKAYTLFGAVRLFGILKERIG
ncbi:MAG: DUF1353 domain-containing protein [Bacteroidetes bacterium]|nr:MAG: DUF1353 domain-containing protein [Bacteroidota bacterium]